MLRMLSVRRIAALTVAALSLVAFSLLGATTPKSTDQVAAETAVTAAISDIADPFRLTLSDYAAGRFQAPAAVSALHGGIAARLPSHFAGAALKRWQAAFDEALDRQLAGGVTISLGGGISTIAFDGTVVDATSATSSGTVRTWGDYADPAMGQVEHGTGYYSFQAILVRNGATWLVSSVDLTPVLQTNGS